MAINISNSNNRDAVVAFENVVAKREVRYTDKGGGPTSNVRVLKAHAENELPVIQKKNKTLDKVAKLLIKEDPEVDLEKVGMFLTDTSRVYVSQSGILHLVEEFELIYKTDGELANRRPKEKKPQNVNSDIPVRWTGKYIKKEDAIGRFVFTMTKQLVHINGLTFDFLYKMAADLAKKDCLLLLRAGENGDEPVVLNRGGKQYNAFLEGRVKGQTYCLLLHLSNMELKRPEAHSNGR